MAIVLEGTLQLASRDPRSTSSKDWKSYLFVLKHEQARKRSVLDFFKDVNKRWQKQEKKGSIELWPYFQVSLAHNCSFKFPLKVTDGNKKEYYLAASSFEAMNKWCTTLQMQSYLVHSSQDDYREFIVQPVKSPSVSLIGAYGDCILAFTPQKQMVCALLSSRQIVGVWPYNSLRTYWGGKERFGFKAGRRSPRGEGEFLFLTPQGEEIYHYLARSVRLTSLASKNQLVDSLPPDPTRSETPVASSESEDEESSAHKPPPYVPSKPPDLAKRLSMGPLPTLPPLPGPPTSGLPGSEVSDTNPAYSLSPSTQHLHRAMLANESKRSQSVGAIQPLPHALLASQGSSHSLPVSYHPQPAPDDDDTYSHATHEMPPQFARNASVKLTEGSTLYHGLVRSESTRSTATPTRSLATPTRSLAGDVVEGEADPTDQVYDLAYPPSYPQARFLGPAGEGEYGSMGDAEDQKKQLVERKLVPAAAPPAASDRGKMLSDNIPFGAQLRAQGRMESIDERGKAGKRDELTDNPLYNSRENLLSISPSFLGEVVDGTGYGTGYGTGEAIMKDAIGMDLTDSMVTNPVYGEHQPRMMNMGVASPVPSATPRPVSPLEHSLVTNPLYGGRQDLGVGQAHRAQVEVAGRSEARGGQGSGSGDHASKGSVGNGEKVRGTGETVNVETPDGGTCNTGVPESEGSIPRPTDPLVEITQSHTSNDSSGKNTHPMAGAVKKSAGQGSENSGVAGQDSNVAGQHSGVAGQDSGVAGVAGQDFGVVGQDSGVAGQDPSVAGVTGQDSGVAGNSNSHPPPKEHTLDIGGPEARDVSQSPRKGYTKVDKRKKEEDKERRGDESPPPPVPPRKYSDD